MDLIREELLRQEKVLAVLLLGADQQQTDAAPGGWSRQGDAAEAGEDGAAAQAYVRTSAAAESWVPGVPGGSRSVSSMGRRVQAEERSNSPIGAGVWAVTSDVAGALHPRGGDAGTQSGNVRLVTEYYPARRSSTTGAQALSRIFERDARRYDGGFASR